MIVSKKMYEEYKDEYLSEAKEIFENIEKAANSLQVELEARGIKQTISEIKDGIKNDTNCDWKLMPDGRVYHV